MILVDMVGDKDLEIRPEAGSDPALRDSIWATAARLGARSGLSHSGRRRNP